LSFKSFGFLVGSVVEVNEDENSVEVDMEEEEASVGVSKRKIRSIS
jgi:hypothetical protein